MKRIINMLAAAAAVVALAAGCDKTYINEYEPVAPIIESFSPQSAPVGAEIVITGQHLNNVKQAFIGSTEMVIKERVSDTRLSITAGANGSDGKIRLVNEVGSGESEQTFTYTYAVPELLASLLPDKIDMGGDLLLAGNNLSAVKAVFFTAEGYDTPNEAIIREQSATEILVRVPYVESDRATITLRYYNGSADVMTAADSAPAIGIQRDKPEFNPVTFERTAVGRSVTITGKYLNKVDKILVNGFEAVMNKQPETLTFTVPAGDFADGETTTTVVAVYFDGHEQTKLSDSFVIYVPFIMFWEGMHSYCQGRECESLSSFFSPATGRVYSNADWRTEVDPVSYEFGTAVCTAANVTNTAVVTEEMYNSVKPYFFFSAVSAGNIQLNGPANSNGQIKNFFFDPSGGDANRCLGANVNAYGTPVMAYRYLNPANADEKVLIDMVKNQTLEHIDEATFPIDVTAQTVAGIGITSCKGTLDSTVWGVGKLTPYTSAGGEQPNIDVDAVILVFYYGYGGYNGNFAQNVRRIGIVHIHTLNYLYDSTSKNYSRSDVTYDCYWQKYDYDYSKIK